MKAEDILAAYIDLNKKFYPDGSNDKNCILDFAKNIAELAFDEGVKHGILPNVYPYKEPFINNLFK